MNNYIVIESKTQLNLKLFESNKWLIFNYKALTLDSIVWFLNKIITNSDRIKQIVLIDINDVTEWELLYLQTFLAENGSFVKFYKDKTFDQAVEEFNLEVQEEIDDWSKSE